jgi:hypothetical protein
MKLLPCFLTLTLTLTLPAVAQKIVEVEEPVRLVRAELLVVRLPEAAALELQPALRDAAQVVEAQKKLIGMIQKKQAELIDWPTITTISENRAVAENIHEVKYPIEFEGPFTVDEVVNPQVERVADAKAPDAPAKSGEPGTAPSKEGKKPEPQLVGGVPTTFETRNVGVTLEIEPTVSEDGKTVTAQLAPQHVEMVGYRREKMEFNDRPTVVVEQPVFQTRKVSTNVVFRSGEPQMLGFYKLKEPAAGKVEIFLVTLTVMEVGKRKVLREAEEDVRRER